MFHQNGQGGARARMRRWDWLKASRLGDAESLRGARWSAGIGIEMEAHNRITSNGG